MCRAMDERVVVAQGRALSTNVTEQHHEAGQDGGGSREADQGLEEQWHGATLDGQALNQGRITAGPKAKVDARSCQACVSG